MHFYVVDIHQNKDGILSYTLAVLSLDGSGPQKRGVSVNVQPSKLVVKKSLIPITFRLRNNGQTAPLPTGLHPSALAQHFDYDLYRLEASVEGKGWQAKLLNALAAVPFGQEKEITVYLLPGDDCSKKATISLNTVSESDPRAQAQAKAEVLLGRD
ncbi:MAG: hypothetical protein ACP5P6_04320 [Candidatus Saccharicenans sp.]